MLESVDSKVQENDTDLKKKSKVFLMYVGY